jgi:hypothetical protein
VSTAQPFSHEGKSTDMQFGHLAEMETINGKCDRQRKQAQTAEQGPEEEPPIMDAFDAADAQLLNEAS